MKKTLLILALAVTVGQVSAQKSSSWTKVAASKASGLERIRQVAPSEEQNLYQVNTTLLRQTLQGVENRWSGKQGVVIQIPNMDGAMERYQVWENSNFAPELQAQFPEIRAYVGKGLTDPTAVIHFSLSPKGIQTMVMRADRGTEFIEPFTTDRNVYVIFDSKTRRPGRLPLACTTEDVAINDELARNNATALANNGIYKTMRLALSCTGEYTVYHGGQVSDALDAMNATMTRCNGVFENDFALHLNIIANNSAIVYTNAATDPYSPAANMGNWNAELQTNLNTTIGAANYDIGHLFGASGGGGNAGCIGCVCVNATKGRGITSPADAIPEGDNFDIDYVAHEMGHQLGANHTFSMNIEGTGVNVEPGSGSTIMGYAGITGATDVQAHSDDYFTYRSILQVQTNLATKTCPVSTPMSNGAPTVSAGSDYTIPKGTAYKLTGSATDPNGDALTYAWEQNDSATDADTDANSFASPTKVTGPNFRSLPPVSVPVRYMPAFSSVLAGTLSTTWESVNTVARTLNFTLTAWDNVAGGGQTNTDAMVVTVNGTAGPFILTAPTLNQSWVQGTSETITWNVAGTTAAPVNTANVNILFSSDAGATWTTLAANVANDGSETITVPNVTSTSCYIMVEAVGNIFYAVSRSFAVGYIITTTCNTYTNSTSLVIPDGTGANTPGATVSNTIVVPALTGTISDVNVGLNVTHTYPNDLVLGVTHPDATQSLVWNRACAGNNNFNVTLSDGGATFTCVANMTGTFAPSSPLSVFNGKTQGGTWTLSAADFWNEDIGNVNSWFLEICTQTAQLATPSFGLTDFAIYPNPNSGNFTIQFTPTGTKDVSVAVHDLRGRQVFEKKYSNSGIFEQNIQLNQVQSGVYLVTVQEGEHKEVRKIVIN
ncbi:T9SS type A sorting domain-containing protein [Flavobacterium sp. MAH-1]|uniref:T9SS type A sorting domain-containing protein n=1 Tax=Flavobacterium agri TaxID=2743471 RepID=A0A7Y8Y0V6_9FLAO|nr:zinc-dependent metalloprotease family protein [Flavobacterium agri]NUY80346.1 T9SS type A sorting domain-containing protein [Flavobacterium agri]NYA70371.1 T9SS type A sorting domain-containing protein [Flavobacterium agri]